MKRREKKYSFCKKKIIRILIFKHERVFMYLSMNVCMLCKKNFLYKKIEIIFTRKENVNNQKMFFNYGVYLQVEEREREKFH